MVDVPGRQANPERGTRVRVMNERDTGAAPASGRWASRPGVAADSFRSVRWPWRDGRLPRSVGAGRGGVNAGS